ncbi:MAG TPA: hypothetical protein VFD70_27680 [Anaerolineae bacterium]|nr:hypothetical protein [Anaerolineae bacterium]
MAIEKTSTMDQEGYSEDPNQLKREENPEDLDWQGLTPATNRDTREGQRPARQDMGEAVINKPGSEYGGNTANRTPMPPQGNASVQVQEQDTTEPQRGVDIDRTSHPDARDEQKVDRLAAPDWRSDQPMPSARNAVDPRGENTPAELFEQDNQHKKEKTPTPRRTSRNRTKKTSGRN